MGLEGQGGHICDEDHRLAKLYRLDNGVTAQTFLNPESYTELTRGEDLMAGDWWRLVEFCCVTR